MAKKEGKPRARIRFLDLDEYLGSPTLIGGGRGEEGKDELDEALKQAAKRKVNRLKMLELDKYLLETEKEVNILKKTSSSKGETEGPTTTQTLITTLIQSGADPKVVNEWLKSLEPQALGALIAMQSNNPALVAMAFGMGQRGQQITVKDVVELNKAMREAGAAGPQITIDLAEMIKAVREGPAGAMSPKDIVDSTVEAIKTGIAIATPEGGHKEESWFDKLMSTPEGVETAQKIGLFGGSPEYLRIQKEIRQADRQFMKDMKEGDRRWQLRLQQYRDDSRRAWADVQEKRRRTAIAEGALKRVGRAVARAVSEAEEGEEEEEEEEARPGKGKPAGEVRQYKCEECGATISVPPDVKPGDKVTCASCGAQYEAEATKQA